MRPYSSDDAESELVAAIHTGDQELIEHLGALVDRMQTAAEQASLLAAALWYAEAGLHIFPIQPLLKIPYPNTHGCKDATSDPVIIVAWWREHPDSNLAIATGHIVDVVDIDGPVGQKSRASHWDIFGRLELLATVTTPRPGGMHLYVPAAQQPNKAGLLPGIDYRGTGGYVLAPPSRTDQGDYRFLTPLNPRDLAVTT